MCVSGNAVSSVRERTVSSVSPGVYQQRVTRAADVIIVQCLSAFELRAGEPGSGVAPRGVTQPAAARPQRPHPPPQQLDGRLRQLPRHDRLPVVLTAVTSLSGRPISLPALLVPHEPDPSSVN